MMTAFFGGIPTQPDVDRLLAEFPAHAGDKISYDAVAKVIGVEAVTTRFRTVTLAWRRCLMRERGLRVVVEGANFKILTADESLARGRQDLRRIGRATGRAAARVEMIDDDALSTDQKKKEKSLLRRELRAMLDQTRLSAKVVAEPKPIAPANLRIAK